LKLAAHAEAVTGAEYAYGSAVRGFTFDGLRVPGIAERMLKKWVRLGRQKRLHFSNLLWSHERREAEDNARGVNRAGVIHVRQCVKDSKGAFGRDLGVFQDGKSRAGLGSDAGLDGCARSLFECLQDERVRRLRLTDAASGVLPDELNHRNGVLVAMARAGDQFFDFGSNVHFIAPA
jgi:hypothetical protein